eukprot:Gb_39223 [translate_table: standard]
MPSEDMKLRRLVGIVKDNAAISRAFATSDFKRLHVAILRATSHEEAPPRAKQVNLILSAGSNSRLQVSYCVGELMSRLSKTHNWAVALKSLIIIHRVLREGGFIFQDQLSIYPSRGGRNYLNLSNFKDTSSPLTWQLSSWVRYYATYLDQWLSTCRILGMFLDARSRDRSAGVVPGLGNEELLKEIVALKVALSRVCECQPHGTVGENDVVVEGLRMVWMDSQVLQEEVLIRLEEVQERMVSLHSSEAVEFLRVVEDLETQEEIFRNLLADSMRLCLLAGSECTGVTAQLEEYLVKVKDSLKAVSALKPLVSWKGHKLLSGTGKPVSQSARFARVGPSSFRGGSGRIERSSSEIVSANHNCGSHKRIASLI